ncbi:MAG: hypothetical protein EPN53_16710 [Acidobacteria bacterium]|nr:MAG: hypothetical protein EPN53_16710 [Acidobacteriota bacterium]
MLTGKGIVLSAALAAWSPAQWRAWQGQLEAARAHPRCHTAADVEAGLKLWRQWAADAGMTAEELAPVLGRLVGCSGETVSRALAGA